MQKLKAIVRRIGEVLAKPFRVVGALYKKIPTGMKSFVTWTVIYFLVYVWMLVILSANEVKMASALAVIFAIIIAELWELGFKMSSKRLAQIQEVTKQNNINVMPPVKYLNSFVDQGLAFYKGRTKEVAGVKFYKLQPRDIMILENFAEWLKAGAKSNIENSQDWNELKEVFKQYSKGGELKEE